MSDYEDAIRASGKGLLIVLGGGKGGGPFWSKGWTACQFGCGRKLTETFAMRYHEEAKDGVITKGWYCR